MNIHFLLFSDGGFTVNGRDNNTYSLLNKHNSIYE